MAGLVPPIPYKISLVTTTGTISEPWAKWIRQMYQRVGGISALSNIELETELDANITDLQTDITSLQSSVTSLQSSVTTLQANVTTLQGQVSDLNQGPYL